MARKLGRICDQSVSESALPTTRIQVGNMREAGAVAIACLAAITLTACGGAENGTAHANSG